MSAQEEPARASTVHVGFLRTETPRSPGFTPSSGEPTSTRPVGQSGVASCWRYTAHQAARPCLAVLGQLAEEERAERVRGLRVRRSYRTDCRAGSRNHRKGQVPDDGLSATTGEGLEIPRRATVGLVQDERLQRRACRNRVRTPARMLRATAAQTNDQRGGATTAAYAASSFLNRCMGAAWQSRPPREIPGAARRLPGLTYRGGDSRAGRSHLAV